MKLTQKQKWEALKIWLQMQVHAHKDGAMMSIAEAIHGEATLLTVLRKIDEIEKA